MPIAQLMVCATISLYGLPSVAPTANTPVPLDEPIKPLPEKIDVNLDKVRLGKTLFFDKRFSRDNKISCASCHDVTKGGADTRTLSIGVDGREGKVNAPTVLNTRFNFRQLWTGRLQTLEEQIDFAISSHDVFDTTWEAVIGKLSQDKGLTAAFARAYPEGMTRYSANDALASYEKALVTPSRFDAYLRGNAGALTPQEKLGYEKFKDYGCIACHQGMNIGGNMFQLFGVVRSDRKKSGSESEADLGRFMVTKREEDRYVFKVPSLRNIAQTAPYFHDGSARTLEQAIDVMFKYQLGRTASPEDKASLVMFLNTLTGVLPAELNLQ